MEFAEVVAALRYSARNLFRFWGRDGRRLFWPWGLSVLGLLFVINTALAQMVMLQGMFRVMDASQRGGDEAGRAFVETFAQMETLWLPYAISEAVAVLLLASAVTRRLHDRGWSGLWGLLPLPFMAFSISQMPRGIEFAMSAHETEVPNNLVFIAGPLFAWATLITLVIILALKGTPGANRFGEATRDLP